MNENPSTTPAPATALSRSSAKLSQSIFIWPAALALAVLLYFALKATANFFTHESTDDAFIAGHVVSIAPRIAGQVTAVHIRDNELVRSNELLIEIDPADYAITVGQKQSAALSQAANLRTIIAGIELMRAKVTTAAASARKARDDAEAAESTAKRAQADFDRAQSLVTQKTISSQEFDAAAAANTKAQADLKSAQENADEETSKVDEAQKQLDATFAEKDVVFAQVSEAQTNVAAANLNLSYTKIFAPATGRITRKSVEPGDYLEVGQQILSIVPEEVWVTANFKESQLDAMRPGQPALVEIDALGGRAFAAHVDSIQAGSGAQFSLLPPENATGNFVKVVQRVPVKIVFDEALPEGFVVGPGLSVTPSVQVSKFTVPAWLIALAALGLAGLAAWLFHWFAGRKARV